MKGILTKDQAKIVRGDYIKEVVLEAAAKFELKNITGSSLKIVKNGLVEYMRLAMEELILTARSARNTNFLYARSNQPG